jgi:hypothetical protein
MHTRPIMGRAGPVPCILVCWCLAKFLGEVAEQAAARLHDIHPRRVPEDAVHARDALQLCILKYLWIMQSSPRPAHSIGIGRLLQAVLPHMPLGSISVFGQVFEAQLIGGYRAIRHHHWPSCDRLEAHAMPGFNCRAHILGTPYLQHGPYGVCPRVPSLVQCDAAAVVAPHLLPKPLLVLR